MSEIHIPTRINPASGDLEGYEDGNWVQIHADWTIRDAHNRAVSLLLSRAVAHGVPSLGMRSDGSADPAIAVSNLHVRDVEQLLHVLESKGELSRAELRSSLDYLRTVTR